MLPRSKPRSARGCWVLSKSPRGYSRFLVLPRSKPRSARGCRLPTVRCLQCSPSRHVDIADFSRSPDRSEARRSLCPSRKSHLPGQRQPKCEHVRQLRAGGGAYDARCYPRGRSPDNRGVQPLQDIVELSAAQVVSFWDVQASTMAMTDGAMINLSHGSSLLLPGLIPHPCMPVTLRWRDASVREIRYQMMRRARRLEPPHHRY